MKSELLPKPKDSQGNIILGRYEVGKILGHGTFAKVYHARNLKSNESVAIKVLDKERILKSGLDAHIKREIAILRRVRHPYIVQLFEVTTTDDPVILCLANEDKAVVFATDAILSALMCAPRSVYSWDIVIQRVGNKLFFDKHDGSQLDLLSVNETSSETVPEAKEDINSAHSLAVEATYINQNFSQQVLLRDGNKLTFDEPNPFASEGEEVASVAYRYRRWKLDDDTHLIALCKVHSVTDVKGQQAFLTRNALNKFDPKYFGVDWRQKLETKRGAVLATELKNNANKLAKWTTQSLLAGADMMKLGYVSRVHPRDHFNHVFLSSEIQRQYREKYGYDEMIPVAANDVAFSTHAVLLTGFTLFQVLIYDQGNQKVSKSCILISSIVWASALVSLIVAWPKHSWLWFVSVFNALQVIMTAIKYIPQAFMNFKRKSTIGWSIGNIALDLTGGLLNFVQMSVQSIDQNT